MQIQIEPLLNRNIIIEKSDNIYFEINKPTFEKVVLQLDRDYEKTTAYYTILFVNNEYKLYYRGCPFPYYKNKENKTYYDTCELADHEYVCLATSNDGLHFTKNSYNIVNYDNSFNNNIIRHDLFCHNFSPFYDKKNNKYLGISGTGMYNNGLHLFDSYDGINWTYIKHIIDETHILPGWGHHNHFDTHNCIVYNEKDDYYYIFIRDNQPYVKLIQYTKTKDFTLFDKCNKIHILDNNDMMLYTPGIFKYENTDYFLGIPTTNGDTYDDKQNSTLFVSHDGVHFTILTSELFEINNKISTMNINSIVSSPDNSKMYIYSHCIIDNQYISCHSFEKNRIQKIVCKNYGYIKTKLFKLNNTFRINYQTFDNGYINVCLINKEANIILNSMNISGNSYEYEIIWNDNLLITPDEYYIIFEMYNCYLYGFSYDYYNI
jgi:hypothetical protein